jgi:hypothetical protein
MLRLHATQASPSAVAFATPAPLSEWIGTLGFAVAFAAVILYIWILSKWSRR